MVVELRPPLAKPLYTEYEPHLPHMLLVGPNVKILSMSGDHTKLVIDN